MKDLKRKVLNILKNRGYLEHQLNELDPIVQATIEATKQALGMCGSGKDSGDFRDQQNYESQDEYFGRK